MYDDYSYLIHSAKGSTWSKKDHKYKKKVKVNGVWKYVYTDNIKEADSDLGKDLLAETENGMRIHYVKNGKSNEGASHANQLDTVRKKLRNTKSAIDFTMERSGAKEIGQKKQAERKAREQDARINGRKAAEKNQLKKKLGVTGDVSDDYLKELEYNTRKNRW